MAVPKRKTSKARKNKRRTHKKLTAMNLSFDASTGTYKRSHHIDLDGEYKGRKVIND